MHLALKVPGVAEVVQDTLPWSTLQVFVASLLHVALVAPVICVGVTEPSVALTVIELISNRVPSAIPSGRPSAQQFTGTVEPAGTSPAGAEIEAVTTASPNAVAGINPAMSATDAYTCPGILIVVPVLQGVSLDKGE